MEITLANHENTEAVRNIWEICFGDTRSYIDAFFTHVYKPEYTLVAIEDNTVIGSLQMLPRTLYVAGKPVKSAYIGGVSVLPQYRNRRVASSLLQDAETRLLKMGVKLTFLVPFLFSFYEKLGYKCISFLSEFSGETKALLPFSDTNELPMPTKNPQGESYSAYVTGKPLYMQREDALYTDEIYPLCEHAECVALPKSAGHLLYEVKDGTIFVLDLCYKDIPALRKLLGFIYEKREVTPRFRIRTDAGGTLRTLLCENTITETRIPHGMIKSLDFQEVPVSMENYLHMTGWF